jgi:hypothetical protein
MTMSSIQYAPTPRNIPLALGMFLVVGDILYISKRSSGKELLIISR